MTGVTSREQHPHSTACTQCRPALYGAGLLTWHYGQAVAAEEDDGHADNTQEFFYTKPPKTNKIFCSLGLEDDHRGRAGKRCWLKRLIILTIILKEKKKNHWLYPENHFQSHFSLI